ncbi:GNAT family N-acetyltransferase [Nocardioides cavernae]|uniref:GNAT family N-acetyltransferase n=1 Tax=Nocardioides cavernae TaxID=1921566 RepID=A0ABR8NCW2_9ACTN|nr:GNAT family N-acetyltransferase [Nocardioides cavernae]MBD3925456.1 GNAT family N-acetyltransferase [Nocardioides cavernae]MBM7514165.1 RimJ/RimL family protein N-acetyltransferase [Nocardioides cavernae]
MIEQVALRDGTDAFVVPLERTDRAALMAEFETLSPESQRRRFLAPVRHLSDAMLDHLVDDVDGVDHIALVLCAETSPDVYDPVALARMVRYADVTDAADLAVTVKDEWQGRGVATVLLEVLMRRRPAGVDRIVTEVLQDNPASLGMLRRLGAVSLEDEGNGVYGVVVELEPVVTPVVTPSPVPAGRGEGRPAPLLHDPRHRHDLHTRDQLCPWFS